MASPRVSVVIAAYNARPYVGQALRSVQTQSLVADEIIVVDDASTDGTADAVRRAAVSDPRILMIQRSSNSGRPAVPRNEGLAAATGELVAFLDADDVWFRDKLAHQVAAMLRESDLLFVYSSMRAQGGAAWSVDNGIKPLPHRAALTFDALVLSNEIPCSSVLARRDAVLAVGGFDSAPDLVAVEDYALWLSLAARGAFGYIPRIHGMYRVHPGGLSRRSDMNARVDALFARRGWTRPAARAAHLPGKTLFRTLGHRLEIGRLTITALVGRLVGSAPPVRSTPPPPSP